MKLAESEGSAVHPCLVDRAFVAALRSQMLRFAKLQLHDDGLAEDAVQEALMGALKNADSFTGTCAFKTWVFAILKNKIADTLRKKKHESPVSELVQDDDDDFSALFNRKGFWHAEERPVAWGEPEQYLEDDRFWVIFEACLDHLPPKQARVFMMREFVGLETDEICATVSLSVSNLHVLLHRARLRLRECLENKWFLGGPCSC
jgi:RNA polymerase sigma-70 factor (TIGR02943 family)